MPGTIQVSVLGLVGLPSSSVSVKAVSMGKKEYQTWDKGEFCFPLTALRDNLSITLHDAEGNELCVKEVETRLIVEKGNLDDILALEGGVNLHLKYQFILTEEDRKRIREMRDSALRKKRGELLASSPRQSESESMCSIGGEVAMPSISLNNVVEDLRVQDGQTNAVNASLGNRKDAQLDQLMETYPNATDGSEGLHQPTPLAEKIKALHLMNENQRIASQSSSLHIPTRLSSNEESLARQLGSRESLFVDGRTHFLDKQRATEKISRNVRKMISTFESSQSQELRPLDNVSTERILPMKGPSDEEPTTQKNDQMLSNANMGLKSYTNDGGLRPSRIDRSHKLSLGPQSTCPSIENPDTDKLDMRASQNQHAQLSTGNDLYYFESSENWIIPGEKRRLCITTASKRVMNLVRAFDNNEETDQTKRRSSKTFPIKQNRYISQEVKKNGKGSHRFRKPKVESSENEKASGGLIGQVVKITIMLAFGTLVLVTRQRSDR